MRKHYFKKGKTHFITCTTRKANFVEMYFGKFTFWKNVENYKKGNCEGAITVSNVELGNDKNCLDIEANKFIDKYLINLK